MEEIINTYFANLIFIKVDKREDFIIYGAAINSTFGDGKKQYVLVFVPTHMGILDRAKISDLHWRSVQTRILTNGYKIPPQKWEIPRGVPSPMFKIVARDDQRSKYMPDGAGNDGKYSNIEMILLHDPRKKSQYQYHNQMNLIASLTSFRCVLSLIGQPMSQPQAQPMSQPETRHIQDEVEEDSFLPQMVCVGSGASRYCTYLNPSSDTPAIPGYLKMETSYSNSNAPPTNQPRVSKSEKANSDFEFL
jgi:hypothetical protein